MKGGKERRGKSGERGGRGEGKERKILVIIRHEICAIHVPRLTEI